MNKEKCLIIFCHEVCQILKIDKLQRKFLFKNHYVWNFNYYTEVEDRLEEYKTSLRQMGLDHYPMKVLNLYFDYEERLEIYRKTFLFICEDKRYKNSVLLLERIEDQLRLSTSDTYEIREEFISLKYFKDAQLPDYVYATLASLWISFENDSVLIIRNIL